MSNIWNAEKLVVGTLISDNIRNSSGEKYSTPESSNTKHQVGEQWISMDGTIPFGGIPFLGQQVSTEVYNELYNWAVENERMISETEWQSLYSSQNGNVPYYAYGEDFIEAQDEIEATPPTQFRMPLYRGYLKAQTVAGSYIAEGLPNITGSFTSQYTISKNDGSTSKGAIVTPNNTSASKYGSSDAATDWGRGFNFDASKSNAIYGKSSHVTPETNTMLIGVYAFNEISNPAIVNAEEYRQAIVNNEIIVNDCIVKVDDYVVKIDTNENNILKNCPVGCIMMYAKSATPDGWLTCNGASINRETYKDLFNVIGTTFGAGDGSTTFALPNLTNKFAMGNDTVGTAKSAGLPNITGALNNMSLNAVTPSASGAFTAAVSSTSGNGYAGYSHPYRNISFNASRSSSIYGAATTVQPPALTLRFIIKY